ncbi:MAG: ABC transporter permease [Propionibacteriaceae bacterium]|nr:ABC transporter permease [Propionibacteriaceae bacterium]
MSEPIDPVSSVPDGAQDGLKPLAMPSITRRSLLLPKAPPPDGGVTSAGSAGEKPRSLGRDAWDEMRHRPMFWVAGALVLLFLLIAVFPQLFTAKDPTACSLDMSRLPPRPGAIFGNDFQGCDIYARTIYGARASILVGIFTALLAALLGGSLGTLAGYLGGWVDAVLARLADIFFSIPMLLGAIVFMAFMPLPPSAGMPQAVARIVIVLALFNWPNIFRLMRASVMQVKPQEYVLAARALGAGPGRLAMSHIVPNAMTPLIVVSTIDLGGYITTEAALSFLGIGLPSTVVSWGRDISNASGLGLIRNAPFMLLFPAAALCLAVLAFILLGDIVRDALDPKAR